MTQFERAEVDLFTTTPTVHSEESSSHSSPVGESETGAVIGHAGRYGTPLSNVVRRDDPHFGRPVFEGPTVLGGGGLSQERWVRNCICFAQFVTDMLNAPPSRTDVLSDGQSSPGWL